MIIKTQNQSRFLSREDLQTPLVVTMDRVTEDATLRNPYILHFAPAHQLKPFPMNVTNRRILTAAYGADSDAWRGQLVEVYFNPSIPNPRNPEQPGGICVRIPPATPRPAITHQAAPPAVKPTPPAPRNGTPPPTAAAPKPAARPATPTSAEAHAKTLAGLRNAPTPTNADEWLAYGCKFGRTLAQRQAQEAEHAIALERIALAEGPAAVKEPELVGVEEDVPF